MPVTLALDVASDLQNVQVSSVAEAMQDPYSYQHLIITTEHFFNKLHKMYEVLAKKREVSVFSGCFDLDGSLLTS